MKRRKTVVAKAVKKNKKKAPVKAKGKIKPKAKIKLKLKAKPKPKLKSKVAVKAKPKAKAKVQVKSAAKSTVKPKVVVKAKPVFVKAAKTADYNKAISPLADRLVVRLVEGSKTTKSGLILLTDSSSAQGYMKAVVLAAGKGMTNKKGFTKKLDVQVGDQVLFSEYAGTKIEFNNEELYIVNETDVLGITQSK